MKKLFITILCLISATSVFSQTAIDFTLNDCNSVSQHLFSTLDKGKIVVLIYEHECSSCTQGTANVNSVLKANYLGDTNIIIMYLDNGGNNCAKTATWINDNNFIPGPYFEYSNDGSSHYGGSGMPIVVITAGSDHLIYLKANGASYADTNTVHNAIKAAYSHILGIETTEITNASFECYPNPANEMINIKNTEQSSTGFISLYDLRGQQILQKELWQDDLQINISNLMPGMYLLKYITVDGIFVRKFLKE